MTHPEGNKPARIVVVMGVASSGKSTVGAALAEAMGVPFLDGDGFHPPANVEKMRAGIALTDDDRWPWLARLAMALHEVVAESRGLVVGASSALRRAYRDYMTETAGEPILFVYLQGSKDVIGARIAVRAHEFMPASLLDSQFSTLEEPADDENAVAVPVTDSVEDIVEKVATAIRERNSLPAAG